MYGKRLSRKPQKGSLEVKDRVRLKKGYLPGWTEEVLQKLAVWDNDSFRVEKC